MLSDLLEVKLMGHPKQDRLDVLRFLFERNRKEKVMSSELWRVLQESHDFFAVYDSEPTQTHLITHETGTENIPSIRQRMRPITNIG